VKVVSFMRRLRMRRKLSTMTENERPSRAFSDGSPRSSAICSLYSRKRASEKRKSASTFSWRKSRAMSGRPMRCVSQVPTTA
jgi:hypothetical protein